jgi:hypothetical protein
MRTGNDELLANQRTDEFLAVQRELLQAATGFRARQTEIETVGKIMGLPIQSDFDDVTGSSQNCGANFVR